MRDLLFVVADKNMEHAVRGFMERDAVHRVIGCAPFGFDARTDIVVAAGANDPGLYAHADEWLRLHEGRYRHAVVMIDADWDGSPGAAEIRQRVEAHLSGTGWAPPAGLCLVLQPEVDIWLWSDSPHAATALGWASWDRLRPALEQRGWLQPNAAKPERPKEAAEWALRQQRKPRSSTIYRQVAGRVSVRRCVDASLSELLDALRGWFP